MEKIYVTDVAAATGSAAQLIRYGNRAFMYDTGFGFCADKMADRVEKELDGKKPECIYVVNRCDPF